MPSKKPIVQAVLDKKIYLKFKKLCEENERSGSKLAGIIIKQYIQDYEENNGEIKIEE